MKSKSVRYVLFYLIVIDKYKMTSNKTSSRGGILHFTLIEQILL